MLFYHSIILWIIWRTWKQPHCLITPLTEWKESWHSCDLKFETNSRFHHNLPALTISSLVLMELIKISKLHEEYETWPLLYGFAEDVKVSYHTRWIFDWFSISSILVLILSWVRLVFFGCNRKSNLKLVAYIIVSMTYLNLCATQAIVTTRFGSRVAVNTGYPWGGDIWISKRQRGTGFSDCSEHHCHSSPIIRG